MVRTCIVSLGVSRCSQRHLVASSRIDFCVNNSNPSIFTDVYSANISQFLNINFPKTTSVIHSFFYSFYR